MRWPWERPADEKRRADQEVRFVLSHIRVLVGELNRASARITEKAERLSRDC